MEISFDFLRNEIIGQNCLFRTPYGQRVLTYADFTASGRSLQFIEKYMIPGKPAYVEKAGFEPEEAIDLIHETGGLAVIAHPGFDIEIGDRKTIETLKNWNIDGLEVIAPIETIGKTKKSIAYFTQIAKDYNLIITGGSDYHGIEGVGAGLGMLSWGFKIEAKILDELKKLIH